MKVASYLAALGAPFEEYLHQDSGNTCYSFRTPQGSRWVKLLNLEQTPIADLQAVIDFYNGLHSPLIPRNWRLVRLEDGILMEHDWVPGRVLHSPDEDRDAPGSNYQRFLRLPLEKRLTVYAAILQLFVEIEAQGVIVEDFYDGCILYNFGSEQAHVIDLDHIHPGSYRLTKDRQFGSSRFMAPEEFQRGAWIDWRTNVYTMGATGFVLLNGNHRQRADWSLSEESYAVLAKTISADPGDRQGSIKEFHQQWQIALK
jgi:serine/threonine protein kinase